MINGDGPKHCIYIAAPLGESMNAARIAEAAKTVGYHVVSTWHDKVGPRSADPKIEAIRKEILTECIAEVNRAHVVIGLLLDGRPRATYCEIGWALAHKTPVVWLANDKLKCVFDAHELSIRIETERDLWGTVKAALGLREA